MNVPDNLEEFGDPPNYDIEDGERSAPRIAFYCNFAKTVGGPVLEIACGSGLVTIPIASTGLDVTGSDLAHSMLERARQKAERQNLTICWVEADARSFDLGKQYQFILLTGIAFQAFLRREDQEALLASVKRHLAPQESSPLKRGTPPGMISWNSPKRNSIKVISAWKVIRFPSLSHKSMTRLLRLCAGHPIVAGMMESALTTSKHTSLAALRTHRNWKRSFTTMAFKLSNDMGTGIRRRFLHPAQALFRSVKCFYE